MQQSGPPVPSKRTSFNSLERGILLPPNVTTNRGRPSNITHRTPLQPDSLQFPSSNQFDALSLETLITEVSSTQTPIMDKQRGSNFVTSQPKMPSQFRSHQGQSFQDADVLDNIDLTQHSHLHNNLQHQYSQSAFYNAHLEASAPQLTTGTQYEWTLFMPKFQVYVC